MAVFMTSPPQAPSVPDPPSADAGWRRALRPLLSQWCRVDVGGADHVPATGAVLLAANHTSHADSIALGLAIRHRALTFVGDRGLTDVPVVGRWLPALGMLPIQRGDGDVEALERVVELLGAGHAVAVFPEGSRSRTGEVHRPRSGIARMATAAGVPVIPVGIAGASSWWPVGRRPSPLGGRVRISLGTPLAPPAEGPRARRVFADDLHEALVSLSGAPRSDALAPVAR